MGCIHYHLHVVIDLGSWGPCITFCLCMLWRFGASCLIRVALHILLMQLVCYLTGLVLFNSGLCPILPWYVNVLVFQTLCQGFHDP